jgi:hypothetical protein
MISM